MTRLLGALLLIGLSALGWIAAQASNGAILWPVAGSVVAAALTAYGTYKVASRKTSGRIGTSEAGELWTASQQIRLELREECDRLRTRVSQLEDHELVLERRIRELETA